MERGLEPGRSGCRTRAVSCSWKCALEVDEQGWNRRQSGLFTLAETQFCCLPGRGIDIGDKTSRYTVCPESAQGGIESGDRETQQGETYFKVYHCVNY